MTNSAFGSPEVDELRVYDTRVWEYLKIAFVSDVIYPFVKGGAEKRIYDFSTGLARLGHEVHVFGVRWWSGASSIELEQVAVHGVCYPMRLYSGTRRNLVEPLVFSAALPTRLARESFDIIDCSEFPYLSCFTTKIAARAISAPLVVTWHEVWGNYWTKYLGFLGYPSRVIEHTVISLSDHSIAVSERVKQSLLSSGASPNDVSVIPNGVEIEKVKQIKPTSHIFDLISIGRLIPEKNLDLLIESVSILGRTHPTIRCAIVGQGPESNRLNELARRLRVLDKISFLGVFNDHNDVIALLKSSKIFMLPSGREGFSMILAEAKACGVPAIVYSGPMTSASDMIEDGKDGFLFHELDPHKVATLVDILLSDDALRRRLSQHASVTSERYDVKQIIPRLERTYQTVLELHRNPMPALT